jgi:hypothetical protein
MRDLRVVTKRWRENEPTGPQISLDRLKEASVSDDAIAMLSGTPRTDGSARMTSSSCIRIVASWWRWGPRAC